MAVYVLHIDPPYQHASHYIGFTSRSVAERLNEHLTGRGNPLLKAAIAAGCEVTVAHVWKCGTRGFERWLKNRKDAPSWCCHCSHRAKRRPRPTFRRFKLK